MTFEPTKLGNLGASLDAEVKSADILLRRLDALSPKAGGDERKEKEGESGEKGDESEEKSDEGVKKAREALAAYKLWLSDPSGEFNFAREDTEEGNREVQDIIDEVLARQRYVSNQFTLLSLKLKPKGTTHIAKLQSYNEVKDAAQELMGLVAENRGVAVGVLYEGEEFGVSAED